MAETIYNVHWDGPYNWENRKEKLLDGHVLYSIFGLHPSYGDNSLLYIGRTSDIESRLNMHSEQWVTDEYDIVKVRLASLSEITTWSGWKTDVQYQQADEDVVKAVEGLLIYANQPAYNSKNKSSCTGENIRIFNTGKMGRILPETSYIYQSDTSNW